MLPWILSFLMYMSWWMDAAVYFVYDLSPIVVTIKENRRNFGHFITRLCAVLGGTFAVTGTYFVLRYHSMHIWKLRHSLTSRIPLHMFLEVSETCRFLYILKKWFLFFIFYIVWSNLTMDDIYWPSSLVKFVVIKLANIISPPFCGTGMLDRWMYRIIEFMQKSAKGGLFWASFLLWNLENTVFSIVP